MKGNLNYKILGVMLALASWATFGGAVESQPTNYWVPPPSYNGGGSPSGSEQARLQDGVRLAKEQLGVSSGPPKTGSSRYSSRYSPVTEDIGVESSVNLRAFEILRNQGIRQDTILSYLSQRLPNTCKKPRPNCDGWTPYRTIDGTCNNLDNPFWGAAFTPFDRLIPSGYNDYFNEPHGGTVSALPSPRLISTVVHPDVSVEDLDLTSMVPQFGQFVDHDITFTPTANKQCCTTEQGALDCWPISIPSNDPFYSRRRQTCMSFVRSSPYCFPNFQPNYPIERQQMNTLTGFIDASNVYGSDVDRARQLRSFVDGKLRMKLGTPRIPAGMLLPTVDEVRAATNENIDFSGTFLAGDARANEMPSLTVLHTLFAREHNRIATQIKQLVPYWNDEIIYQKARRILGAEMQNIVYGEYLPVILGDRVMRDYNLELGNQPGRYFSTYNPTVVPAQLNAFATAAYRFGHSMITGPNLLMKDLRRVSSYNLRDNFLKSDQIFGPNMDGSGYNRILEGLTVQPPQTCDNYVTGDVTNFLFRRDNEDFGQDLIARNLMRGRDHGLPCYNEYRKYCGLRPLPRTFNINNPEIYGFSSQRWQELRTVYRSPEDIDLFTGGLVETRIPGAQTGETFNCIMRIQFYRTKFGDRFFFTHSNTAGAFTASQVEHIRRRKLSDIICDNSDDIRTVPYDVFRALSPANRAIQCDSMRFGERTRLDVNLLIS